MSLHRRGFSSRRILVAIAFSFALCILYYTHLRNTQSDPLPELIPEEDVVFWPTEPPEIWAERAVQVKNAFLHAYHGYERYAFPHDELTPLSNASTNSFNQWGVTAVDSLDTMLLMGLKDEYERALPMIMNTNFSLPANTAVPFFETVIRYLGGLLSAYALSNDTRLLTKADELGAKLLPAFNTESGPPVGMLAEIASWQLEYSYLGKITGKEEYAERATMITDLFYNANLTILRRDQYLLTAQTDKENLEMYIRMTTHVINNLMFISPQRHLVYVTDMSTYKLEDTRVTHHFEHLSCFFPGLLALGVKMLPLDDLESVGINLEELTRDLLPRDRGGYEALSEFNLTDLHLWAAEAIAQTCYITYADQPTGLGPETVSMRAGGKFGITRWMSAVRAWDRQGRRGPPPGVGDKLPWSEPPGLVSTKERDRATVTRDYGVRNIAYYLRPETVESFYMLWRVTGDVRWRYRGWHVFQAIEREAKTSSGYACVDRVHMKVPVLLDSMPSYFLAETLKYLYLLFLDEDIVPLDRWVFNTEAHPLPVFAWTPEESVAYEI
ncbi:glycoside hydrolase family 47 protein [Pisolithus orientalis]|uniref:glycoside hydrolase family 47 protein n=1 Tax=Pisolithus orientalis TaxID=936130 RepID=UPI002225B176|nr:glycoside hydrolase family 47 protein [Pisolithus orientalis]KAI6010682.1 glycoside hydrolase family 47 protein [Pisolithus orientalis]